MPALFSAYSAHYLSMLQHLPEASLTSSATLAGEVLSHLICPEKRQEHVQRRKGCWTLTPSSYSLGSFSSHSGKHSRKTQSSGSTWPPLPTVFSPYLEILPPSWFILPTLHIEMYCFKNKPLILTVFFCWLYYVTNLIR